MTPTSSGATLVYLTPIRQSPTHNAAIIHRSLEIDESSAFHVAGGEHTGIIINKQPEKAPDMSEPDISLSFSVWLNSRSENSTTQEKRILNFVMSSGIPDDEGKALVHDFFKQLMTGFPKDYVSFLKRMMTMLLKGFRGIESLAVEFQLVDKEQQVAIPDAAQYDSGSELEEVTAGHVQEILEHAFPNGLTVAAIAESLRCNEEEVSKFLHELEYSGIARRLDDEWIRYDPRHDDEGHEDNQQHGIEDTASQENGKQNQNGNGTHHHQGRHIDARYTAFTYGNGHKAPEPTVAIISCLFLEKQAIDAIIEDSKTIHKYKSGGDSNVYTMGRIGEHQVVATKLAVIGDTREAITSAGSITTRLLGNFQNIEHVFVVGVGGAVPHYTDAKKHARLGDVFVSHGHGPQSIAAYIYANDVLVDRDSKVVTGFSVRKWSPQDSVISRIVEEGADGIVDQWHDYTNHTTKKLNANQGGKLILF
ncbi:hypothetical protein WR25_02594 isoform A [Diploscapter pachys]|uniref:Winged helix-turn-helix domain-containing protein n=2 Tax=Diploscapter pachys TaxID=2018661 RepID=A0A2A2LAH8_9BILA|nr:hypothetical protein WR25_02594 isoform A [Diploscapter pachys]